MATSDRNASLAGRRGPCDACTDDMESSTVIRCTRPPVVSFSLRPSTGRMRAVSPQTTWERLSLVET
jgi:hypothetical protein